MKQDLVLQYRLRQSKSPRMAGPVGEAQQQMKRCRRASRRADPFDKPIQKTIHDKQQRLAIANLVVKGEMFLEQLVKLGKTKRMACFSIQAKPKHNAFVPEPSCDRFPFEPGKSTETLDSPE
jgi:hypothetical protein